MERKLKTQEVPLKTLHSSILGDQGQAEWPGLPAFLARVQTPQPRPEHRGPSCLLCGMEAHPLGGVILTSIKICHLGYTQCQRAWASNCSSLIAKWNPWPCGQVLCNRRATSYCWVSHKGQLLEPDKFHKNPRPRAPPIQGALGGQPQRPAYQQQDTFPITSHAQQGPRVSQSWSFPNLNTKSHPRVEIYHSNETRDAWST